jgi:hypothetical protein
MLKSRCSPCSAILCSELDCGFLSSLISVALRLDSQFFVGLDCQHLRQVHQLFIACDIEVSLGMRLPASIYALKADLGPACKAVFLAAPAHPSASQQQVSDTLQGMALSVEDEFRCPNSGYSIDTRVHDKRPQGTSTSMQRSAPVYTQPLYTCQRMRRIILSSLYARLAASEVARLPQCRLQADSFRQDCGSSD